MSVAIPEGTHTHTDLLVIDHPDAQNVEMIGAKIDIVVSSVGTATGSAYAWDVPLTMADATGVAVGHYICIASLTTTGTGEGSNIEGSWRVTAVAGNVVTVRVTNGASAFPTIMDTNFAAMCLKSVLQWDSAQTGGLYVAGTTLGLCKYVVFDGQYDVASGAGSDSAGNGLFVGGFVITILGLEADYMPARASATPNYCAFVRWKADGVLGVGNVMIDGTYSYFCSNGWRGFQAGGSSAAGFAKGSVASGNRKSGYEAESAGNLTINNSTASGNGEAGIYSPFSGFISATNCRTLRNIGAGIDLRQGAEADVTGATSRGNTTNGLFVDAAQARADTLATNGNTDGDVRAQGGGKIIAKTAMNLGDATPYRLTASSPGYIEDAAIQGVVTNAVLLNAATGNHGGGSISPISTGDLLFSLRADGGSSTVAKFRMRAAALRPEADATIDLGEASLRWNNVRAATPTINTSDQREKQDVRDLTELERRVAIRLKASLKTYRWIDAVQMKGDNARIHIGVIAQDVIAAFSAENLDATKYGVLCHDVWDAEKAITDQDGIEISPARAAGDRYGVRYNELFAFVLSAL